MAISKPTEMLLKGLILDSDFKEYGKVYVNGGSTKVKQKVSITLYDIDQIITLEGIERFLTAVEDTFDTKLTRRQVEVLPSTSHDMSTRLDGKENGWSLAADELEHRRIPTELLPTFTVEMKLEWPLP